MTTSLQASGPPELAYTRRVFCALELLDAVTLARISRGLQVTAVGLDGSPIVNASGLFVWLEETDALTRLQRIAIAPERGLPYQPLTIPRDELQLPFTSRQLVPRVGYPFTAGTTALRGALIEDRGDPRVPIVGADVWLQWLQDDATWRDAPLVSTSDDRGEFATILRLGPDEAPKQDAKGALTVRLRARRSALSERRTDELSITQGHVADPSTFAWNEMHP
jgi:hypothetical protein